MTQSERPSDLRRKSRGEKGSVLHVRNRRTAACISVNWSSPSRRGLTNRGSGVENRRSFQSCDSIVREYPLHESSRTKIAEHDYYLVQGTRTVSVAVGRPAWTSRAKPHVVAGRYRCFRPISKTPDSQNELCSVRFCHEYGPNLIVLSACPPICYRWFCPPADRSLACSLVFAPAVGR